MIERVMNFMIGVLTFCTIAVLLTGCGTTGQNPEAGYFMVSKGNASGVVRLFGGGVDYCKVTQSNLDGVTFTGQIVYDGKTCTVEATASDE